MKNVFAVVVLLCLQHVGLHAAESTPLLGGYSKHHYQQTCRSRLGKGLDTTARITLVAGCFALAIYYAYTADSTCIPHDATMNGACKSATSSRHVPIELSMPDQVPHSYDKGHGSAEVNRSATAQGIEFSPAVQALAQLDPTKAPYAKKP